MTTPDWNFKQVILRVFDDLKNALRVFVVNTATDPIPVTVVSVGNTTPDIANVSCPIAGTEYNYALPAGCRKFLLRSRNLSKITFAYETAATNVLTLENGVSFEDSNTYLNQTLYFKCSKAEDIVEVVTYV